MARSARSLTSTPKAAAWRRIQARSLSRVPAFTTRRNQLLAQEIDDEVIEHAALLVEHAAVERLAAHAQLADVVGEQLLEEGAHARTREVDHAHVRDVEHAGGAAHGVVLADLRAVLDRHVPAAEIHHARAEFLVQLEERRLSSHRLLQMKKSGRVPSRQARGSLPPFCPVT